jgi:hypothetical protein
MAYKAAIKITPQFDPAGDLQKLTLTVQRLNAQTQQLNQKFSARILPFNPKLQSNSQLITQHSRRTARAIDRLERIFNSVVSRLIQTLGGMSRFIIRGFNVEAFVISPVMGLIGSVSLGILPMMLATATGIFKWLWNKVAELGDAMIQDRMLAMRAGTTVGAIRAFRTAFPMINDPNLIGNVALTRIDLTSRATSVLHWLLKVKKSNDSMTVIVDTLIQAREFMKKESADRAILSAQNFKLLETMNAQTLLNLREMTDDEFMHTIEQYHTLRPRFSQTVEAQNMLVDFILQIKRMWINIETKLGKTLVETGITKSLENLSKATLDFIDFGLHLPVTQRMFKGLEGDIQWFADWLGDTKNQKRVGKIVQDMILNFEKGVAYLVEFSGNVEEAREMRREILRFEARKGRRERGLPARPRRMPGVPGGVVRSFGPKLPEGQRLQPDQTRKPVPTEKPDSSGTRPQTPSTPTTRATPPTGTSPSTPSTTAPGSTRPALTPTPLGPYNRPRGPAIEHPHWTRHPTKVRPSPFPAPARPAPAPAPAPVAPAPTPPTASPKLGETRVRPDGKIEQWNGYQWQGPVAPGGTGRPVPAPAPAPIPVPSPRPSNVPLGPYNRQRGDPRWTRHPQAPLEPSGRPRDAPFTGDPFTAARVPGQRGGPSGPAAYGPPKPPFQPVTEDDIIQRRFRTNQRVPIDPRRYPDRPSGRPRDAPFTGAPPTTAGIPSLIEQQRAPLRPSGRPRDAPFTGGQFDPVTGMPRSAVGIPGAVGGPSGPAAPRAPVIPVTRGPLPFEPPKPPMQPIIEGDRIPRPFRTGQRVPIDPNRYPLPSGRPRDTPFTGAPPSAAGVRGAQGGPSGAAAYGPPKPRPGSEILDNDIITRQFRTGQRVPIDPRRYPDRPSGRPRDAPFTGRPYDPVGVAPLTERQERLSRPSPFPGPPTAPAPSPAPAPTTSGVPSTRTAPTGSVPSPVGQQVLPPSATVGVRPPFQAGPPPLVAGPGGKVNETDFYSNVREKFRLSPLNGFVPKDGDRWGIKTGSPDEWARLAVATAKQENNMDATPNKDGGMLQFKQEDLKRLGVTGNVADPNAQTQALVNQWSKNVPASGVFSSPVPKGTPGSTTFSNGSTWGGAGTEFGSLQWGPTATNLKTIPSRLEHADIEKHLPAADELQKQVGVQNAADAPMWDRPWEKVKATSGDTGYVGTGGFNFMGSKRARDMGMGDVSLYSATAQQTFETGITDGKGPAVIRANKYAGPDIAGFLKDLHDAGAPLKDFAGAYVQKPRQHGHGNAVDIETGFGGGPDNSPALYKWAKENPELFQKIQDDHHMKNLTKEASGVNDWGHFEWSPQRKATPAEMEARKKSNWPDSKEAKEGVAPKGLPTGDDQTYTKDWAVPNTVLGREQWKWTQPNAGVPSTNQPSTTVTPTGKPWPTVDVPKALEKMQTDPETGQQIFPRERLTPQKGGIPAPHVPHLPKMVKGAPYRGIFDTPKDVPWYLDTPSTSLVPTDLKNKKKNEPAQKPPPPRWTEGEALPYTNYDPNANPMDNLRILNSSDARATWAKPYGSDVRDIPYPPAEDKPKTQVEDPDKGEKKNQDTDKPKDSDKPTKDNDKPAQDSDNNNSDSNTSTDAPTAEDHPADTDS